MLKTKASGIWCSRSLEDAAREHLKETTKAKKEKPQLQPIEKKRMGWTKMSRKMPIVIVTLADNPVKYEVENYRNEAEV